jgi:DNA-binding MurR/RpiR family transcriptional regulator
MAAGGSRGQGPGRAQEPDVLGVLRGLKPTLVPSKQRVAAAILSDPARVSAQTISELAVAAETSEATVVRLCRDLGLRGYRELRIALAAEAARESERQGNREVGRDIGREDDLAKIIETVTYADQQAIADSARLLDRAALAKAVALIATARRIDIVGVGASAVVALDLHQKLHRIGLVAYAWHDVHAALTAAALSGPRDVAIGISHSGTTSDTLDAIRESASHGAKTIALTGVPNSPLGQAVDACLVTVDREMMFRSGATASRIAALSVVDVLFVAVAQRRYDDAILALDATRRAVASRRDPGQ